MASTTTLRLRRGAAQLHALEGIEREIRATDPHSRRKYLREFREAYREYQAVLSPAELRNVLASADIVLVGDYHALPASQRYAARLLAELAAAGPVVLAVESVFARDQHVLDEWMRGEIDETELRERIRFDFEWGYPWPPFAELFHSARHHAVATYGIDCMPRGDLRRIGLRDRHAAQKIAEIRARHPEATLVVLFGESHLAPNHLPRAVRRARPLDRTLTVLQNVDELYWRTADESVAVPAVRVRDDVVCVFNSTLLEKYESYRLMIESWRQPRPAPPDLAPTVYNVIQALMRFLKIDKNATSGDGRLLLDVLPEIYCRATTEQFRRILSRKLYDEASQRAMLAAIADRGSCYDPRLNAIFIREFHVQAVAEDAASFLHHACRGALGHQAAPERPTDLENDFYARVLSSALIDFGARALCLSRAVRRESDLYSMYSLDREAVEQLGLCTFREFMAMLDFMVLHKDYEASALHYRAVPDLLLEGVRWNGCRRDYITQTLGAMLGSELWNAYVHAQIGKRALRSLFFRPLTNDARVAYFVTVRRIHKPRRRLVS